MQQRRANSSSTRTEPLVSSPKMNGKRKRSADENSFLGPKVWSILVLVVMALLVVSCIQQFTARNTSYISQHVTSERGLRPLPLSQFPTLSNVLESSELVGLYFAASWCPMSSKPTALLGEIFGKTDILTALGESGKPKFALVYVSSDKSADAMQVYMKPDWIGIPFESDERTAIKKHFSVCAASEMAELGIERKFEIPSLFILDGETHGLISTNGVSDVTKLQSLEVMEAWTGMQHIVQGLSEKYID